MSPECLKGKIITQLLVVGRYPIKKKKTLNLPLHSSFQYQLNQKWIVIKMEAFYALAFTVSIF